jgi:hypothetical protein
MFFINSLKFDLCKTTIPLHLSMDAILIEPIGADYDTDNSKK